MVFRDQVLAVLLIQISLGMNQLSSNAANGCCPKLLNSGVSRFGHRPEKDNGISDIDAVFLLNNQLLTEMAAILVQDSVPPE